MNFTEEHLRNSFESQVSPALRAQISPEVLEAGMKEMLAALNEPQRNAPDKGRGR